jgi:chromosomal replication initiator protein
VSIQDPTLVRLASAIAHRVGSQRFQVWFDSSTRLSLRQDTLDISVPNDFISDWIGKNFTGPIQEAANEVLGTPVRLKFVVSPQLFERKDPTVLPAVAKAVNGRTIVNGASVNGASLTVPIVNKSISPTPLTNHPAPRDSQFQSRKSPSPSAAQTGPGATRPTSTAFAVSSTPLRHDFLSFVVGPSNELAYRAAVHVSENTIAQYNPLFIHGPCGLGKTHLLQSICRRYAELHATRRCVYLTGEDFTNEYIQCVRTGRLESFRRKLRDVDLLVIDDVHFLSGKKATQEEFLHTFNAIEASGKQVVMASDNHPNMINEFCDSLINRFMSGFVVRVDAPTQPTRAEILKRLGESRGIPLPPDVIDWIARRVTQNVRELEGAFNRLVAHVQLRNQVPDLALAIEALAEFDKRLSAPLRHEALAKAVCDHFGLQSTELMSGKRQKTISLARSMAMYLIRKHTPLSFPEIGSKLGDRNHSTVISACRRIESTLHAGQTLAWQSATGPRTQPADQAIAQIEEHARSVSL